MATDRLDQLLGVVALSAADRIRLATEHDLAHGGALPAALVHLEAYPDEPLDSLRVALRISQPGAVRVVDRLEEQGLVQRRPGPDGRTRALRLTSAGLAAAHGVQRRRASALSELTASLSASERGRLLPLLERITSSLAVDRPGAVATCRLCDRDTCCGTGAGCPLAHTTEALAP
ncbi:MAG TPA: MarR family transcriptional regulator [Solirubrobacteraceae bacterium]|jgi:DNA-binding MarR family transcriptional regulator